ncbi:hypothetical protein Lalb_Chr07g0190191 [Lupinus albus]|uniref:Uncharacterized protein n=1 Tax=Lupinus albus TaxID=3870 RepID=A0A6A4Q991_LUPAL|nr:hypothetical protein Lalb_Chr07g0190191 [Lupinus albus]
MSNFISLVLFFLCISLHACYARPLTTVDKKLEMKYHFSLKVCPTTTIKTLFKYIRYI